MVRPATFEIDQLAREVLFPAWLQSDVTYSLLAAFHCCSIRSWLREGCEVEGKALLRCCRKLIPENRLYLALHMDLIKSKRLDVFDPLIQKTNGNCEPSRVFARHPDTLMFLFIPRLLPSVCYRLFGCN